MKKIIAILMTLCLMAGAFCIQASALTVSSNDVIRVYGLQKDGTTAIISGYKDFAEGWEAAVDYAEDHDEMEKNGYERIVVELLADWNANEDGEFGDSWRFGTDWGDGFQYSTIYVPSDTRLTINMNGHTINRGLKEYEYDGEVICINDDADVIINDGTITGGFSCNGAGGIHMQDGSKLTLNHVNVTGNRTEDDDGGGIAVYDGATLIMNGGSIANNTVKSVNTTWLFGAGVYIEDSTATFNNVTFQNNHSGGRQNYNRDQSETYSTYGVAIYAKDSHVTMDSCEVYDNAHHRGNFLDARSVICANNGSIMTIKNTIFRGNGDVQYFTNGKSPVYLGTMLFDIGECALTIEACQFTGNKTTVLFDIASTSSILVSDTHFTDNNSAIYYSSAASNEPRSFINCTFDRNTTLGKYPYSFEFAAGGTPTAFTDCNFGNSSFNDRSRATIVDSDDSNGPIASIFGAGSLAMIVAILALVVSGASIGISITSNKKKAVSTASNSTEKESV